MSTSVPSRPAPGATAARLVAVPSLRERAAGPTRTVRAHLDATAPATVLVRALPHAGPSARIGVPGLVHAALLALVAGQCVVLDVAGHGAPAGATLLVLGLSGALLLRYGLARPVVAMRHAVLDAVEESPASGTVTPLRPTRAERVTGGPVPPRPSALPHSRVAELARIRWAVLAVGARRSGTGAHWCYWPAGAVVAGAVAPVLVWSVLVATAPAPALVDDPVVATAAQEGAQVAARVSGLLDDGLRAVRRAAGEPADLAALVGRGGPFAGVRTRTPAGATGAAFGHPVDGDVPRGDGLSLADAPVDGRPVVTAAASAPDGTVVVAEFDVRRLVVALHEPDLRITVVDRELRTVLDTHGFLALAPVAGAPRAALVTGRPVLDGAALLTPVPLTAGPAADLGWTALVHRPAAALLPGGDSVRPALLVAVLAALVALGVGCLHLIWHVVPLRRAARLASGLAAGDRRTVLVPERHDDVGAMVMGLDLLRRTTGRRPC